MSLRQVFLDTETTGFSYKDGDRVVEIGCVEFVDGSPSGRELQIYLNPEGKKVGDSFEIHGLSDEFLAGQKKFSEVKDEFLKFVDGAEIIAHNSDFDIGFLNNELSLCGDNRVLWEIASKITDTMILSKKLLDGQLKKFKLDHLLDFYDIDRSNRDLHGALLDSQLLSLVYTELVKGVDLSGPTIYDDVERPEVVRFSGRRNPAKLEVMEEDIKATQAYIREWVEKENVEPIELKAKSNTMKMG